jgi:glycosyltransferase involved in cell wall biosynthesis
VADRVTPVRLAHITTVDLSLRFLLRDQLLAFRTAGFEVFGVSAPGPWVDDLRREGVEHVPVPSLERRWNPTGDVRALVRLIALLREIRPTIVHTHTPKAGVLGRIAARLAGVPIVLNTVHGLYGTDGSSARRRFFLLMERVAAWCSDFEFCQSREDLETLRRLGIVDAGRSAYLGNGVDVQTFDPGRIDGRAARTRLDIAPDALVVGTVGRLVWEKGYREFFAMAEGLKLENPRVVVLAVGPRENEKGDAVPAGTLDDLAGRGVVRFLGMRTDMPEIYATMDIFVLPSYREGFPRSAIEAAAMGRPLVLTDIRGCREVVEEDRNGFLIPPRRADILLDRVRRLAGDAGLRQRFGQESRRRARAEFDEHRVVETTLGVYRRLLTEKHGIPIGSH